MRRHKIKWFNVILFVVLGYFSYVCVQQQVEISKIHSEMKTTTVQLEQVNQHNEALREERERLSTPAYVEKLAREELGLVKPGEVPYMQNGKK